MSDTAVLSSLEPVAARLLERHLSVSKPWYPHELIPYERGRARVNGHGWSVEDADLGGGTLTEGVSSALVVNLLTEDNLPYYFRSIERIFGADGTWGTWARRWTAEEGRHSMAIYGYLMTSRALDPYALENDRMHQVSGGVTPEPASVLRAFVYLALQELATRVSHRNTGRLLGDPIGYDVMARVAADENLHHLFYRDLTVAALELDPDATVRAIEAEVIGFAMPGLGIRDFDRHAAAIARAGIYDLGVHHEQVLAPLVLRHWRIDSVQGLSGAGERSRDRLMRHLERIARVAGRLGARRSEGGPGTPEVEPTPIARSDDG